MNPQHIVKLLERVKTGEVPVEEALNRLRDLPFEDLEFARIDTHRELRIGVPEIVWGENKSATQLVAIARRMTEKDAMVLISRVSDDKAQALLEALPLGTYHEEGRIFSLARPIETALKQLGKIVVLAAGTSDLPVAQEAAITAQLLGNDVERIYDVGVAGLHRLLHEVPRLREASVLIVVAGMEGALPSVVAGLVGRPIIAVPTSVGYGTGLGGFSALLTMLNGCAPGVTVVNIDNGVGAAVAAHLMNRQFPSE